jgi:uncharacterized Zn finger protein
MNPPEPFVWEQRDALTIRCTNCGEVVRAEAADLHACVGRAER